MRKHFFPILFFLSYLFLGLNIVDHYGMSWDEAVQRNYGLVALDYVMEKLGLPWEKFEPDRSLNTNPGKQYTVLFSMFCAGMERLLGLEDDFRGRYLMRHIIVFLLFWSATVFFYKLLFQYFRNWKWSLLGIAFIVLSPRIFAHSFYNPKDIVLLSFYLIASYTLVQFLFFKNARWAIWHGMATGIAINGRFPALILVALTIFMLLLEFLQDSDRKVAKKISLLSMLYLGMTALITFMFFPYLWESTASRATESFQMMANFPWGSQNLWFGTFVDGENIPWYYIPVWMGITTPLLYLLLYLIGVFFAFRQLWKNIGARKLWRTRKEQLTIVNLGLMLGPLCAVVVLQSTLYNGWRQLYFIYPAFIFLAITGLYQLWGVLKPPIQWGFSGVIFLSLFFTIMTMVRIHPNQQVYFNVLAGKRLAQRFDMDYWGVAYYQAWQALAEKAPDGPVTVKCANYPCEDNFRYLPNAFKNKVKLVWNIEQADFFMSNFRRPGEHQKFMTQTYPYSREYFSIKVYASPIIGVYKLE